MQKERTGPELVFKVAASASVWGRGLGKILLAVSLVDRLDWLTVHPAPSKVASLKAGWGRLLHF